MRLSLLADEHAQSGEPLDLGDRLIGFTFEDSEQKADKVALQLDNFDLSLFDRKDIAGGAVLEVSWGYPGNMAPPRRVVLKKLKGFTTLTLEGRATSVLMDRESRTRAWEGKTRAQVAEEIAREQGYSGAFLDIEETQEVIEVINQAGETDARFLKRLAGREGFDFFVDDGGFHFRERKQASTPTHVFTWYSDPGRGDLLSLKVESDLTKRVGKVTLRGRDPLTHSTIESAATNDSTERATLAEVIEVVDPDTGETRLETRNATASVHTSTAKTANQIRRESSARYRRAERSAVKLSMRVVGDPSLHAKSIVEVRGISALLSGKYYLREVKHVIAASGYTCDLKLTRDGSGRRARQLAQEQRGEPNRSRPRSGGAMTEVEVVDPDSGDTHIEYRRDGQPLGAEDPEGMMSIKF